MGGIPTHSYLMIFLYVFNQTCMASRDHTVVLQLAHKIEK